MSAIVVVTLIAVLVVLVVLAAVVAATLEIRRRALLHRFGPEYSRLASEIGPRKAEAQLAERRRRVARYDIRPLTAARRAGYADRWNSAQERFVDDPPGVVGTAASLVTELRRDRGYPAADAQRALEDLSVNYAYAVSGCRQAEQTLGNASSATTDELRKAMLKYRVLFTELLGSPDDGRVAVPARQARATATGTGAAAAGKD